MNGLDTDPLSEAEMKALSGDLSALPADYLGDANIPSPEPEAEGGEPASTEETAQTAEPTADETEQLGGQEPPAEPGKRNVENVPLAVFMEAKKEKQEAERRLMELTADFERANARIEMIMQAQQQQQQQAQQQEKPSGPPDPREDVLGATEYAIRRINEFDQRAAQSHEQREAQRRQEEQQRQVIGVYSRVVQERVAQDPSFSEAQSYLINSRYQELLADGYDPEAAQRQVHAEEFNLAYDSLARRINPADRIAAIAKARGWQPQGATQSAPADPAAEAAAKLDAVKAGQAASATLSSAGATGAGKSGKVDASALAKMSDDEFEAWLTKNGDKGFNAVLGG